jgi:hypothetical protein
MERNGNMPDPPSLVVAVVLSLLHRSDYQVGGSVAGAAFTWHRLSEDTSSSPFNIGKEEDSMVVLPVVSVEESLSRWRDRCCEFVEKGVARKRDVITLR